MSRQMNGRSLAAALVLVAAATQAVSAPASADVPTHLTTGDAKSVLGAWGLDSWTRAEALPPPLRWKHSCSTWLRGADRAVIKDHDDAGIRSRIAVRADSQAARSSSRSAAHRVAMCQARHPESDRVVTGLRVRTSNGSARAYGTVVGSGRQAQKLEYVIVARSGRAVEVSTFRVFAQDVLPRPTLSSLVRRTIARLHNAR